MMKFIVFVFAVICFIKAGSAQQDANQGTGFGNWRMPQMQPMQPMQPMKPIQPMKPFQPQDIENMKGAPGGQSSGVSQQTETYTVMENGKPVTKTRTVLITNINGTVTRKVIDN